MDTFAMGRLPADAQDVGLNVFEDQKVKELLDYIGPHRRRRRRSGCAHNLLMLRVRRVQRVLLPRAAAAFLLPPGVLSQLRRLSPPRCRISPGPDETMQLSGGAGFTVGGQDVDPEDYVGAALFHQSVGLKIGGAPCGGVNDGCQLLPYYDRLQSFGFRMIDTVSRVEGGDGELNWKQVCTPLVWS